AQTKSIRTLSALKEKTGVDRKTLRSINAGQPVKRTTLQSIANKLRVPISHLLASNAADENADKDQDIRRFDEPQYQEIKLQKLDGASLRQLAGETDEITWSLHIDQMPVEIEAILSKLEANLRHWYIHLCIGLDETNNLAQQISYIKTSTD